jgi:hypothetical protein
MSRTLLIAALSLPAPLAGRAAAHPPWGITVDERGRVCFADIDHGNHIWRIEAPGKLTSVVSGRHSHDLRLDRDGNLFLADLTYIAEAKEYESRLLKLTPSGASSVLIPTTTDRRRFWANGAFALDREGGVYFGYTSDPRAGETGDKSLLQKRSPDGRVAVLAGSTRGTGDGMGGRAQFTVIHALAWGLDDVLYVSDTAAVRKVTRDGTVTTLARDLVAKAPGPLPFDGANHLFGLAVAADGAVFVADYGSRRVLKVTAGGRVGTAATSEPPWAPSGVAVADHDLYLLEVGSTRTGGPLGPRVRKVSASGEASILATVDE